MTQNDSLEHPPLDYNPQELPRELKRHYIAASEQDIAAMLEAIGKNNVRELFDHLPKNIRFEDAPELPEELDYNALQSELIHIAAKNKRVPSFLGDGLQAYSVHSIVPYVANIRNLTTAYTPYQPERSQGTLISHWIYQCVLSHLTGFEAVNASLYDRATALFEALCASSRMSRKQTVIVCKSIFPGDIEVLETLANSTSLKIQYAPIDTNTGLTDIHALRTLAESIGTDLAAIAFPQVNHFGLLEDVDTLADLAREVSGLSIASIDPMLLASGGLKPPSEYGSQGVDIIVGEAQHLAIGPNFGGPGLGLFGVRHNSAVKNHVRSAPGRFVGKAKDAQDRDCYVMVLSTREQHIRQERATSNICSNQAFLATMVGAAVLARGEDGMREACLAGYKNAHSVIAKLLNNIGVELAFPETPFFNECVLKLPVTASQAIEKGVQANIHIGIDVSERFPSEGNNFLKISFSNLQSEEDCQALITFFESNYGQGSSHTHTPKIPDTAFRTKPAGLPSIEEGTIKAYYQKLGDLNISPDNTCYPLGSCTMKYNPHINDWAANLPGFTDAHPQAPSASIQGCLEVLFETQNWFKAITGLPAVTTQPVAGAQGELVGIKLFQAYHKDHGEPHRNVIFIPESAHGTNFATAMMAGFETKKVDGKQVGIVRLKSSSHGEIDMKDLENKLAEHGPQLCGIMITNPNTCGIFESRMGEIADKVHAAGGLVYMDGANMNAIAGWVNLGAMGVDAVHNNLHKTWTIPHGGGGPGDAIVAVSERLIDYLPGRQIIQHNDGSFEAICPKKSIGSVHRHWGNFAHKVRCYAYLRRLGRDGVRRMSAISVLSARYLFNELCKHYPILPQGSETAPRMHEFILTLEPADFERAEQAGIQRAQVIPQVGKLFLDFGFHAPTVAWPETYGLMIEPTESYSKAELDRFAEAVIAIRKVVAEHPEALKQAPRFTPVERIDEVTANRDLTLSEPLEELPPTHPNRMHPEKLMGMTIHKLYEQVIQS
ncbi:MAG TPA: aminomethyl-transferring glycine dehydrogenase subunit GcvPA [Opitutae bacterium]|nr:aminomethyl-transferring glycine dehydrogenase subunit GcvPA [Opitutae bacterium]